MFFEMARANDYMLLLVTQLSKSENKDEYNPNFGSTEEKIEFLNGLSSKKERFNKNDRQIILLMNAFFNIQLGRYWEAVLLFRNCQVLSKDSTNVAHYHLCLGLTYYLLKDYEKAFECWKKARDEAPDYVTNIVSYTVE